MDMARGSKLLPLVLPFVSDLREKYAELGYTNYVK